MSTTEQIIKEILKSHSGVPDDKILLTDTLEILDIDSLDKILVVLDIEEEFGVYIDDEEITSNTTISDLINKVDIELTTN